MFGSPDKRSAIRGYFVPDIAALIRATDVRSETLGIRRPLKVNPPRCAGLHPSANYAALIRPTNRRRNDAPQARRRVRTFSTSISAAGVMIKVRTVANPRPNTIAVERLIHHWVAGAPMVISRAR